MTLPFKYFDDCDEVQCEMLTKYLTKNYPYQYTMDVFPPPEHWLKWLNETVGLPMLFTTENTNNLEIINYDAKWEWMGKVMYFKNKNDLMLFTLWKH